MTMQTNHETTHSQDSTDDIFESLTCLQWPCQYFRWHLANLFNIKYITRTLNVAHYVPENNKRRLPPCTRTPSLASSSSVEFYGGWHP